MKLGESLKYFVSYFQSRMALVYNCNDDVGVTAFISGLQVSHSYKHLEHEVTRMRDILSRSQMYIQIENTTRGETNLSPKRDNEGEEQKPDSVPPKKNQNRNVVVNKPTQNPASTLTAQTYTESLLNDGSTPDGRSYSLYRVLTLTAQIYTESMLNDKRASDGRSYNLYRVLILTAQTYIESLLNNESVSNGRSYSLY